MHDQQHCLLKFSSSKFLVSTATTYTKKRGRPSKSNKKKEKSPSPETQIETCLMRPKRQSAQVAQGNLKEPSVATKMRRWVIFKAIRTPKMKCTCPISLPVYTFIDLLQNIIL